MDNGKSLIENINIKLDQLCYEQELHQSTLIRRKWIFIWSVVACFGVVFMTFLTCLFQVWPLFYYGVSLLLGYAMVLPGLVRLRSFDLVSNIFCVYVIIVTCLTMVYLGGITTSHGLILVGLNCAMASVLTDQQKWTIVLFQLYGLTILVAGVYELSGEPMWSIDQRTNIIFFIINILWINATTLFLVFYYMITRSAFEKLESERLKALDEAKTNLYTDITHEFRTPLTVILGMANEIRENPTKWMEKGIKAIINNGNRLLQLVNQILDLSKLKSGMVSVEAIRGDAIQYLEYLTESFQGLAESKEISLQFHADRESLMMDYDEEKWMHIFSNLISNAIKYTPKGGSIKIAVDTSTDLKVSITDTGIGIAAKDLKFIYDRYYRAEQQKEEDESGFGLGLALSKELIQLIGGNINVESSPGRGTTFTVHLPVETIYEDKGEIRDQNILMDSMMNGKELFHNIEPLQVDERPLLLIVEDNRDVIDYLQGVLENDYLIIKAENGSDGLEKAIKYIPDIIISDVMMPVMDGYELLESLRDNINTDHIPIVMLTAKADRDSKIEGIKKGANAYLFKPFDKTELFATLNQQLIFKKKIQEKLSSLPLHSGNDYSYETKFLRQVHELIDANLQDESFNIQKIYEYFGMSRTQFYRKFGGIIDQPIGRYLKRYRLHKARQFLTHPEYNVTQAAMAAGFKNLSHFSSAFKNEFGFSPKEA